MIYKDQEKLLNWFYLNQRSMPWREDSSPYRVWISEVMLQQTTVATVTNYFLRFMEKFPNLSDLAQAKEEEVLTLWSGLGYYTRARNILKTAQLLKEEENFPKTYEDLLKLPGVGPYTAGAIASIAFGQAVSLIDTNVDRVLGRYYALDRRDEDFEKDLRAKAQQIIEQIKTKDIRAWNQAIMELGAIMCGVHKVGCSTCPLKENCKAFLSHTPLAFPGDKPKTTIIDIVEYALLIKKDDKMLFTKNTKRRKGMYDFPISTQSIGLEIGEVSYRISNNKVKRIYCELESSDYQLQENDLFLPYNNIWENYPLTSPCKKFLQGNC